MRNFKNFVNSLLYRERTNKIKGIFGNVQKEKSFVADYTNFNLKKGELHAFEQVR